MATFEKVEPIKITDNNTGEIYTLDFSRDTVRFAEERGFVWDEIGTRPATMVPIIWYTAFRRYNPRVSYAKATEILEKLGGMKPNWITRLRELYDQSLISLISVDESEGDEDKAKNAEMTVEL